MKNSAMKNLIIILLSFIATTPTRAQLNDHLVARYFIRSADSAKDETGHGYNGYFPKGDRQMYTVADRNNRDSGAFYVAGYQTPLMSVDNINIDQFDSACSVSFWANLTSVNNSGIQFFYSNSKVNWVNIIFNSTDPYLWQLQAQFQGGDTVNSPVSKWYVDGQWNNYVFTCSYKGIDAMHIRVSTKAYFNGNLVAKDSVTALKFGKRGMEDLQLAGGFIEQGYSFAINDVRFYNKVLSAGDVHTLATDILDISPVNSSINGNISAYPNPCMNKLYIIEDAKVEIYNLNGQLVKTAAHEKEINISGIIPGMYILAIQTKDEIIYQKQIIGR